MVPSCAIAVNARQVRRANNSFFIVLRGLGGQDKHFMMDLLSLIVGVSFLYIKGIYLNFNKYFLLNTTPMKKCIVLFLLILSNITYGQTKSKEELLKSIVGQYDLNGISAITGDNLVVDYFKSKGLWKLTSAMSLTQKPESLKIASADLIKLKTTKIIVNKDLSIKVSCNDFTIATIPFKADGMVFELKGTYGEDSREELSQLKPGLIFNDEVLFLYAKDNLAEAEFQPYNLVEILPSAIIISYNFKEKEFQMMLCESEGMGSSTYTFRKSVVIKK
jgi:hypothetical protein